MVVGTAQAVFRLEWAHSLKEKRMTAKSLIERTQHKFRVAVAEVDTQEVHQTLTIGIACVSNEGRHAEAVLASVQQFLESSTEAELIFWETELIYS